VAPGFKITFHFHRPIFCPYPDSSSYVWLQKCLWNKSYCWFSDILNFSWGGGGGSLTSPGSHLPKQTTKEKTDGFPLLPMQGAVCGDAKWTFLITKNKKRWNATWCRVPLPTLAAGWLHANNCRHTSEISSSFSSWFTSTSFLFWQKAQKPQQQMKKGNVLHCGIWGLDKNGNQEWRGEDTAARLMATSWCMSLEESYCIAHIWNIETSLLMSYW